MYFLYLDESGQRGFPATGKLDPGSPRDDKSIYVLCGLTLFDGRWDRFNYPIESTKLRLINKIKARTGVALDLHNAEIHSVSVRIPKRRSAHPFLSRLEPTEIDELVSTYFDQLSAQHMRIIAVVFDKRYVNDYDGNRLHRTSYEFMLERFQNYLRFYHTRHMGVVVIDDTSKQLNLSLAEKHSFVRRNGTSSGLHLYNIVEAPFFVPSEMSNGIQLADLCAYTLFKGFRSGNLSDPLFRKLVPHLCGGPPRPQDSAPQLVGLKVFPPDSELNAIKDEIAAEWNRLNTGRVTF